MKRQEFLNQNLTKLPPAPRDCLSLTRLSSHLQQNKTEHLWVGGEILDIHATETSVHIVLFGQGLTLHLEFSATAVISGTQLKLITNQALLMAGDRVAAHLTDAKVEQLGKSAFAVPADELLLLAPAQIEEWPFRQNFERQQEWRKFLNQTRHCLEALDLCEVFTPSLVECPGTEPSLEPFQTFFRMGQFEKKLSLPTSPELQIKKMIAGGWTDIFEIKTCFRNGEVSDHHEPEFTMLEWYRAYGDLETIIADLKALVMSLHTSGFIKGKTPEFAIKTMQELFAEILKFDLQPTTDFAELRKLSEQLRLPKANLTDWNDLFHYIFLTRIEPQLNQYGPLIIKNYPPSQRAYSRLTTDGWADRFEFYWRGLEIANAFHEINDPKEQEQRFGEDVKERQRLGTQEVELDQDFIHGLRRGWPPTGGIALGLERLFMASLSLNDMESFKAFPWNQRLSRWSTSSQHPR